MSDRATDAPAADAGFLRRWSQRKHAVARGETPVEPPPAPVAPAPAREEAPLPDPATLTLADDFSAFLRDKVPPELKRKAMQHLFSHPHFNEVDMLDVYMEDFNQVANLDSPSLALVKHARAVLDPAPEAAPAEAVAQDSGEMPEVAEADSAAVAAPVDDTDTSTAPETPDASG